MLKSSVHACVGFYTERAFDFRSATTGHRYHARPLLRIEFGAANGRAIVRQAQRAIAKADGLPALPSLAIRGQIGRDRFRRFALRLTQTPDACSELRRQQLGATRDFRRLQRFARAFAVRPISAIVGRRTGWCDICRSAVLLTRSAFAMCRVPCQVRSHDGRADVCAGRHCIRR